MAIGALLGGIGGLASGASSIFSGLFGGGGGSSDIEDALRQSAQMQYQSYQNALNYAQQEADRAREYLSPYYGAGYKALPEYMNYLGLGQQGFDASKALSLTPGYNFMQEQGVSALDRSAAAGGLLGSGAHRQGLLDYGQNLALTKAYEPYMNRLSGLVTMGQNTAAAMGGVGTGTIPTMTNLLANQSSGYQTALPDIALSNALANKNAWNQTMGGLGIMTGTFSSPQFTNALGGLFNRGNQTSGLPTNWMYDPKIVGGTTSYY